MTLYGIIETVAGNGILGYGGDGGPATMADIAQPAGVAVDGLGNLFIADTDTNVIREVMAGGKIVTVIGTGTAGFSGDNGPAAKAELNHPNGVSVDAAGDLFIADTDNNVIRGILNGRAIVVDRAPTSTTVTSSASPVVVGQSVTFTATVMPSSADTLAPGSATVTFYSGTVVLGTAQSNSKGVATFTTSALAAGNHSISAVYAGDANELASTSNTLNIPVVQATTTTLASSVSPSVQGQSVTFTATVSASGSSSVPTGTVTFKDGTTSLGSGTLDGTGVATFTTSSLAVGTHSVTAVYGGDNNDLVGTSTALSQIVNQDKTSTILTSSANPSLLGNSVTLQAIVSVVAPGAGGPTGTVTFEDGATILGTASLNSSGVATFATTALAAGQHIFTAVYGSDSNHLTSTSSPLTQTIQQKTTTTLTSSANPSVIGQTVTFTAHVSPVGTSAPSRLLATMTAFKDGTTTLGTAALNGSGVATFAANALSIATHSIKVVYGGDANDLASNSIALGQIVKKASTSTTLTASANPAVAGQAITLTAKVSAIKPGAGVPTGSVTFKDGTTVFGAGKLSAGGVASFATSSLAAGIHSITAVWSGGVKYGASTSATLRLNVKRATSVVLSSSANPAVVGQSVTLTATVTAKKPSSTTPTGTISFMDGSTLLGTATLVKGVARLSTSKLSVASHAIRAVYNSDGTFATSTSAILTETVKKAATNTTLSATSTTATFGVPVTFFGNCGSPVSSEPRAHRQGMNHVDGRQAAVLTTWPNSRTPRPRSRFLRWRRERIM